MRQDITNIEQHKLNAPGSDKDYLLRSRANLQHLIYSMEHDRSLNAPETKIIALRELLGGIERQLISREIF